MTSLSIVRPAVPQDEAELWRLFRANHRENALFPISDAKVQYYLDRVLFPERLDKSDTGPRGIIGVIGPVGALEGCIMLVIGSLWYSDSISMEDCMNFVDPDHRCSNHARALIGYAKHVVDETRKNHADFRMVMGIVSTIRTAAKVRIYEREFSSPVGAFFLYPRPADFVPVVGTWRGLKRAMA